MDTLEQMRTFVRVVEGKSLSAAARAQRRSLAAVSRQLRALEDDLGVERVARTTRRLRLTDAGERWYEHAVRILGELERARASVSSSRTISGRVTVSTGVTLGLLFVVPRLAQLLARHSQLEIDLRAEDRPVDLVADGVDVALRGGLPPPDSTSVVARPVMAFARYLVASPKYLEKRGVPRTPRDLARHDCLVQSTPTGPATSWDLVDGEKEISVRVSPRLVCNAPAALRDAARLDGGIALIADWLAVDDVRARRLKRILPEWQSRPINVWALHRADARGTPRIAAVLDALCNDGRPK